MGRYPLEEHRGTGGGQAEQQFRVHRSATFEAAHFLPTVPSGHPCSRVHGHSYTVEVSVAGPLTPQGWVIDFDQLDHKIERAIRLLDHRTLNDVEGLEVPTAENIALWILLRIEAELPKLTITVIVSEGGCGRAEVSR